MGHGSARTFSLPPSPMARCFPPKDTSDLHCAAAERNKGGGEGESEKPAAVRNVQGQEETKQASLERERGRGRGGEGERGWTLRKCHVCLCVSADKGEKGRRRKERERERQTRGTASHTCSHGGLFRLQPRPRPSAFASAAASPPTTAAAGCTRGERGAARRAHAQPGGRASKGARERRPGFREDSLGRSSLTVSCAGCSR